MATIAVRLSRGNIIVPYRTLVHLGEEVRWTFEGDLPGDSRVEVYFDNSDQRLGKSVNQG